MHNPTFACTQRVPVVTGNEEAPKHVSQAYAPPAILPLSYLLNICCVTVKYTHRHLAPREQHIPQVIKLKNIPPKEQEACKNEVELLSRMCHPNIVGYTNSFLYKNCLCIIMEYCDAGDLGDRVNEAKVRADHRSAP